MRLSMKLTVVAFLNTALLIAAFGWLSARHELRVYDEEMRRDASLLAMALDGPVSTVWDARGTQPAKDLVEAVNHSEHQVRVRWVWLDVPAGHEDGPRSPDDRLSTLRSEQVYILEGTDRDGGPALFTYIRLPVDSDRPAGLELSESLAQRKAFAHRLITRTWLLALSIILSGSLLSWFTGVRLIGTPVSRLIEKTRRIADGEFSEPLVLYSRDEFTDLADALNTMGVRLREARQKAEQEHREKQAVLEQARHQDRLRTVGTLASGMAHELGTPLNVVTGRASLIATGELPQSEVEASAHIIREQGDRMTKIIRHLLDFARETTPERRSCDLRQIAKDTVELLDPQARERRVELIDEYSDEPVEVIVDRGQLEQVLTNLVVNAVYASQERGRVRIGVRIDDAVPPGRADGPSRSCAVLSVIDEGRGIAAEDLPHIFDPFFTRKEIGQGTGLGLSIAHGIVEEHGGWIVVRSEPGHGSEFLVYLPREDP